MSDSKAIVLIDGGFLRVTTKRARLTYDPNFIERFALKCRASDETIFRILYYDCAPYTGTAKLPITGTDHTFTGNDAWLHELSHKNLFAVRRGILKFRGFKPKRTPATAVPGTPLTDADFDADFEQKGVDMRIGLDIAAYAANRSVERIVLVSNDTDCVPALKYGRRAGLQTVLVEPPTVRLAPELLSHADLKRSVTWP